MIDFITTQQTSGFVRVELSGEIDQPSAEYFFACIAALLATGIRLAIIDCAGLGRISLQQRAQLTKCRDRILFSKRVVLLTNINLTPETVAQMANSDRLTDIHFPDESRDANALEKTSEFQVRNRIRHFSNRRDLRDLWNENRLNESLDVESRGIWRRSHN